MQRPCFALAMLLGAMASSVVVVGASYSPSPVTLGAGLPGPAMVCGVEVGKTPAIVRSQGEDEPFVDVDDPAALRWSTLTATGYDPAFDFAMFDGSFDDVAPSQFEIATAQVAESLLVEAPAISLQVEFLTVDEIVAEPAACHLDCSGETMLDEESDEPTTKFCPWTGEERPMELEPVSPTPVPVDDESVETSLMGRAARSIQANWSNAKDWSESVANHPWLTIVRDEIAWANAESSFDDLFGATVTAEAKVIEDASPSWELENILLHTANSLEQLSQQLQQVAQRIRDFANDRIVARHLQEPVTR